MIGSRGFVCSAALVLVAGSSAAGQTGFTSGSTGADGPGNFTTSQTVSLDEAHFDASRGAYVYNYTTITVASGVTLRFEGDDTGEKIRPVVWLASGDVTIDGVLDLTGTQGTEMTRPPSARAPAPAATQAARERRPRRRARVRRATVREVAPAER